MAAATDAAGIAASSPKIDSVLIRRATRDDAEAMGFVGPAAYAIVYAYMWDDSAALSRQLATFSAAGCRDFLARPDTRAWVAQIDGDVVGFLKMVLNSPNPVDAAANGAEIPRIYLLPGSGRLGLGRKLMDEAVAAARAEGQQHVWLAVKGSADNAHAAYLKWGFSLHGVVNTKKPVKAGFEALRIMIKPIG